MRHALPTFAATVYSRCLWRAAKVSGGVPSLATFLGVSYAELVSWLTDVEPPPNEVFLKAVDLVVAVDVVLDISDLNAFLTHCRLPARPSSAPAAAPDSEDS